MRREIIDYQILTYELCTEIRQKVLELTGNGYELYGHPFATGSADGRWGLCQAMVKYKETE